MPLVHVAASLMLLVGNCAFGSCAAAAAPAAAAQAQAQAQAQGGYMVVELELQSGGDKVTTETLTKVFVELGASPEKFKPVIDKHASGADEKILVTAGDKATCETVKNKFVAIGMKAEVRALTAEDVPSEYDGSDVVPAGQAKLKELLDESKGQGILVAFTAPWCKHCHTLAPELKAAAAQLKASGVRVAAVDTQTSQGLAQSLGVKMLPTIKWLQPVGDNMAVADYQGARDAASIVRFAQAAGQAIEEQMANGGAVDATKEATAAADANAARGSKIGASKLGKSKADGPATAGSKIGESKAKESEVQPSAAKADAADKGAATEGVQKAETPEKEAAAAAA